MFTKENVLSALTVPWSYNELVPLSYSWCSGETSIIVICIPFKTQGWGTAQQKFKRDVNEDALVYLSVNSMWEDYRCRVFIPIKNILHMWLSYYRGTFAIVHTEKTKSSTRISFFFATALTPLLVPCRLWCWRIFRSHLPLTVDCSLIHRYGDIFRDEMVSASVITCLGI